MPIDTTEEPAEALRDTVTSSGKPWRELGEKEKAWYRTAAAVVLRASGSQLDKILEALEKRGVKVSDDGTGLRIEFTELEEFTAGLIRDRDDQKARADRAEERSQELATLMLGANREFTHRIAALENVVEVARDVASKGFEDDHNEHFWNSSKSDIVDLREKLAALDSAQPAPDARDERIRELEAAVQSEMARVADLASACDAIAAVVMPTARPGDDVQDLVRAVERQGERIRELEAELAKRSDKSAEHVELLSIGVNHNADRVMELKKRIRVACAELRGMRASAQEMGYRGTAADLSRIARELEGKDSGQPAPAGCSSLAERYPHYFKRSPSLLIDVYRVIALWDVKDPALQHALKKLLAAGGRGAKSAEKDVQEAMHALERWQEMRKEDDGGSSQR